MKKVVVFTIILIMLIPKFTYAENELNTEKLLEEQKAGFKIENFIEETKKYIPDFLKEMNINIIFESAIKGKVDNASFLKKTLKFLGVNATKTAKILIEILIIVLIHSILKTLTDSLENSEVSKIVYYVQYILIVAIMMNGFSSILETITDTIDKMVGFTRILMPLLTTLMLYTGSITTTSLVEPILLFLIEFIANIINKVIVPVISMITVFIIVSKITDKIQITKLANFMKSSIVWFLGIIITLFIGVLSLEGSLTSSIDGITAKTTKAAVSNLIPVVRKSFRRWSRCNFRKWCSIKKCCRYSWSDYNNRDMCNSNYKTRFV